MSRIGAKDRRRGGRGTAEGWRRRRLQPAVMALEGRALRSTFTVTNTDDGPNAATEQGTLRWAVGQANSTSGADTIAFDSTEFSTPQTITLTAGPLALTDTATTTIDGPGAALLSVSGNHASRVFEVAPGASASLSGLTITGGSADYGGGLYNENGSAALTGVTVSGNTANVRGGGVETRLGGSTTLTGCTISGNTGSRGGGLDLFEGSTLTLTGVTVSGNTADYGGGLDVNDFNTTRPTVTVTSSTFSGNSATIDGGGLSAFNIGLLNLTNVTVSGNTASLNGGGLNNSGAQFNVTNCTVSGNTASRGGGLYSGPYNGSVGTTTLTNTIVAAQARGGDVRGIPLASASANNLIGDGSGELRNGTNGNQVGTSASPIDPLLAPLGDYGGPIQTMALLPGSPAIDRGTSTGAPAKDQRGESRVGAVDIGAFESQGFVLTPVAGSTPQATQAGAAFANPLAVIVTANNAAEPVVGGVVTFTVNPASNGASATLSAPSATITAGSNAVDELELIVGDWAGGQAGVTATANATLGRYTVTASAAGASSATFNLANAEAPSLVVTTAADVVDDTDGLTSLREAVAYANSHPGADTITFAPDVRGAITLTLGQLVLSDAATTTVDGPGAGLLSVSGNNASGVFDVSSGASAALSGLTITGGKAGAGGGVDNFGTLTMTDCTISGNSANSGGGLFNGGGSATLTGCTVVGNSATYSGGLGLQNGSMSLSNVTISGNTAEYGGGVNDVFGTLTMTDSTVSGNTAIAAGGGLYIRGSAKATLTNVTVSGNTANTGGGLFIYAGGSVTLTNTIVAAQARGGDVNGALDPSSTNNLIGDGTGMTGLTDGTNGNQVGTSTSPIDPLLAPLGDYGGPTRTMALLPGSPAIDQGTGAGAPAADQRGESRVGNVDIGAFESQGFTVAVVPGSTPQSAQPGMAFADPLAVTVTANNASEPVNGGVVTFTVNPAADGASAALSAVSDTIAAGQASVTASANSTPGRYGVTASAAGASSATFDLTNIAYTIVPKYNQTQPHPAGSLIAIKIEVTGPKGANLGSSSLPVTAVSVVAPDGTTVPLPGGVPFTFNPATGTYKLVLNPPQGTRPGTYTLNFTVGDDSTLYSVQYVIGKGGGGGLGKITKQQFGGGLGNTSKEKLGGTVGEVLKQYQQQIGGKGGVSAAEELNQLIQEKLAQVGQS